MACRRRSHTYHFFQFQVAFANLVYHVSLRIFQGQFQGRVSVVWCRDSDLSTDFYLFGFYHRLVCGHADLELLVLSHQKVVYEYTTLVFIAVDKSDVDVLPA